MLDGAVEPHDLKCPPGNRLEKLRGERRVPTAFASTINTGFALFWPDHDAYDVEVTDYH